MNRRATELSRKLMEAWEEVVQCARRENRQEAIDAALEEAYQELFAELSKQRRARKQ